MRKEEEYVKCSRAFFKRKIFNSFSDDRKIYLIGLFMVNLLRKVIFIINNPFNDKLCPYYIDLQTLIQFICYFKTFQTTLLLWSKCIMWVYSTKQTTLVSNYNFFHYVIECIIKAGNLFIKISYFSKKFQYI